MTTPGIVADSSAAGLAAQLDEEWRSLESLGRSLSDDEWSLPTACPGWPVSAHYAHIVGTESTLLGRSRPTVEVGKPPYVRNEIGQFNEVWVGALAPESRSRVLDVFAEVTAARREALAAMSEDDFAAPSATPVGQADYRRFMQIRVFDCWVHEQDVRDAVGHPGHESGPVAEQAADEIVRALGYIVGKKAAVPNGSSVCVELAGSIERRVNVAVVDGRARVVPFLDDVPTATVTLSSAAFTRLACGRADPASVSGVTIVGNEAIGRQVVENLAFTI